MLKVAKEVMGTRRKVVKGHQTALDSAAREAYGMIRRLHKEAKKAGGKEKEKLMWKKRTAMKRFRKELARCRMQEKEAQSKQIRNADSSSCWWKKVRTITGQETKQRIPALLSAEDMCIPPRNRKLRH